MTIEKALIGKTITKVRYLTPKEAKICGWDYQPLLITLDCGNQICAQSDDEGNQAGALATSFKGLETIGVQRE